MELKIYLNKTYKNTCNLISIDINCKYFNIISNKEKKQLLIDNLGVFTNNINSIEFLHNGYKNIIEIYSNATIFTSEKEYTKNLKAKNVFELNNIINNL